MPLTFELAAFGWHATIFVSWGSLAVLALLVIIAVVGTKLLAANAG
jgi:hypothetical protein